MLRNSPFLEPRPNLVRIETDECPNLQVRDPPLLNQSTDVVHGHPQMAGQHLDIDEFRKRLLNRIANLALLSNSHLGRSGIDDSNMTRLPSALACA